MSKNPKSRINRMLQEQGFQVGDYALEAADNIRNLEASYASVADIALSKAEALKKRQDLAAAAQDEKMKCFATFMQQIHTIREGKDSVTGQERPRDISFAEAVKAEYGCSVMEYLRIQFGVSKTDTLSSLAKKTGLKDVSLAEIRKCVSEYGRTAMDFTTIQSTQGVKAYTFIIPEVILAAIQLGYTGGAKYVNWIAATENVATYSGIKVPFIEEGNLMPQKIKEGGSIPMGTMKFGDKTVKCFKVGIGVKLTQELVEQSSISMVSLFLSLVGAQMSRGADVAAIDVLVNGDQADLSENAPVIGIKDTADGLVHFDIDRVYGQMDMLNQTPTVLITRNEYLIADLNETKPQRDMDTVEMYAQTKGMDVSRFYLPNGQYLFVDTTKCMMELNYGSMRVTQETDYSTETEVIRVTKYVGFSIAKRDARVIVDSDLDYAANPIPSYMDVEAYLAQGFSS